MQLKRLLFGSLLLLMQQAAQAQLLPPPEKTESGQNATVATYIPGYYNYLTTNNKASTFNFNKSPNPKNNAYIQTMVFENPTVTGANNSLTKKTYARNNAGTLTTTTNDRNVSSLTVRDVTVPYGIPHSIIFRPNTSTSSAVKPGSKYGFGGYYNSYDKTNTAYVTALLYLRNNGGALYYPDIRYTLDPDVQGYQYYATRKLKLSITGSTSISNTNGNTNSNRLCDIYFLNNKGRLTKKDDPAVTAKNDNFLNITVWQDASITEGNPNSIGPFGDPITYSNGKRISVKINGKWYMLVGRSKWNSCDYAVNFVPTEWWDGPRYNKQNFTSDGNFDIDPFALYDIVKKYLTTLTISKTKNKQFLSVGLKTIKNSFSDNNPKCKEITYGFEIRTAGSSQDYPSIFKINTKLNCKQK